MSLLMPNVSAFAKIEDFYHNNLCMIERALYESDSVSLAHERAAVRFCF
jgi:hypothetical protein